MTHPTDCRPRAGALVDALLLLFALAGCGGAPAPPPAEPVRLGLAMHPSALVPLVAQAEGLFERAGLAVAYQDYPSGKRALEGLAKGEVDVVTTAEVPVALAAGLDDLRVLAETLRAANINRLVVRRERLRDDGQPPLAALRIGTQVGSAVHFYLHLLLLEQGLREQDAQLRFLPVERLAPALAQGEIDAFSMREPLIAAVRDQPGQEVAVLATPGLYSQVELLVGSRALAEQRPVVVERLLRALIDAQEHIYRHPQQAALTLAQRLRIDLAAARELAAGFEVWVGLEQSLLLQLEDEHRWARAGGFAGTANPNFLDVLHPGPLGRLAPGRVTLIR